MQWYYGTKEIYASPMTRGTYNDYRGWTMPDNENGDEPGYLVEYVHGGGANHPDHDNYISWSPADVFEGAYQPADSMSFGHALVALKQGCRVARAGWNGKDMFLYLVSGSRFLVNREPLQSILGEGTEVDYRPHIDMKDAEGKCVPWLASQTDMLAEDWCIVRPSHVGRSVG